VGGFQELGTLDEDETEKAAYQKEFDDSHHLPARSCLSIDEDLGTDIDHAL